MTLFSPFLALLAGDHGIIASKRCDHLVVKDNISYDNLGSGIMLHELCDDSVVSGVWAWGGGRGGGVSLSFVFTNPSED